MSSAFDPPPQGDFARYIDQIHAAPARAPIPPIPPDKAHAPAQAQARPGAADKAARRLAITPWRAVPLALLAALVALVSVWAWQSGDGPLLMPILLVAGLGWWQRRQPDAQKRQIHPRQKQLLANALRTSPNHPKRT